MKTLLTAVACFFCVCLMFSLIGFLSSILAGSVAYTLFYLSSSVAIGLGMNSVIEAAVEVECRNSK